MTERRKWTVEEDAQLLKLIEEYGTNWKVISSHLTGRLPKQCRERWINHLGPGIVKGKLTQDEWNIVMTSRQTLGNRWSEIAKLLPGRTPNQIKNMWHAIERKRSKTDSTGSRLSQPHHHHHHRTGSPKRKDYDFSLNSFSSDDKHGGTKILGLNTNKRPKLDPRFQMDIIHNLDPTDTDTDSLDSSPILSRVPDSPKSLYFYEKILPTMTSNNDTIDNTKFYYDKIIVPSISHSSTSTHHTPTSLEVDSTTFYNHHHHHHTENLLKPTPIIKISHEEDDEDSSNVTPLEALVVTALEFYENDF